MSPRSGPPSEGTAGRLAAHALAKPGAWADQPWDGDHVAKLADKILAFLGEGSVGVKCGTRVGADEWLAEFPDDARVMPYIGRSGWNTLSLDGAIAEDVLREAADVSYELVVAKLPRSRRPAAP